MDILATSFVADSTDVASSYPSAGRDSSDPNFQAIYWRCVAGFLFSAAVNAPDCQLMLFSNVAPPVVDGVELRDVFARLGVTAVCLPLTHRLPDAERWGNVFYFMDIMRTLPDDGRFALFDSDVVLAGSVKPLVDRIGDAGMVAYRVDSLPDEDVNGLTMTDAAKLAAVVSGSASPPPIRHLGGELLGIDLIRRADILAAFDALWHAMVSRRQGLEAIRTEEHFWSIAAAAHGWRVDEANDQLKRLWTAHNFRTVRPGDEARAVWHMPAEKRYGFVDLFRWMADRSFDPLIDPLEFHGVLKSRFGIPHVPSVKRMRDVHKRLGIGLRRVGESLRRRS